METEKIGIATSVAKDFGYSWRQTIRWALDESVRHVQFYVNDFSDIEGHLPFIEAHRNRLFPYFHLPPTRERSILQHIISHLHAHFPEGFVAIQHQPYLSALIDFQSQFPTMTIAVENDAAGEKPEYFLHFLQNASTGDNFWAVLDVSRFYHQAPASLAFDEITTQIFELFAFIQKERIPFMIHAIDIKNRSPERENWAPFLEGMIPWPEILKSLKKMQDLLKCFVFEYENWDMCRRSIEYFKKAQNGNYNS